MNLKALIVRLQNSTDDELHTIADDTSRIHMSDYHRALHLLAVNEINERGWQHKQRRLTEHKKSVQSWDEHSRTLQSVHRPPCA